MVYYGLFTFHVIFICLMDFFDYEKSTIEFFFVIFYRPLFNHKLHRTGRWKDRSPPGFINPMTLKKR